MAFLSPGRLSCGHLDESTQLLSCWKRLAVPQNPCYEIPTYTLQNRWDHGAQKTCLTPNTRTWEMTVFGSRVFAFPSHVRTHVLMCVYMHACLWRPESLIRCHPRTLSTLLLRQALLLAWNSTFRLSCVGTSSSVPLPSTGAASLCYHTRLTRSGPYSKALYRPSCPSCL